MKILLQLVVFAFAPVTAFSQQVTPSLINSTGSYYTGSAAGMDVSVGEPVIVTLSDTQGILTQGFLQPSYGTLIAESITRDNAISVYPNPAADELFINDPRRLVYSLQLSNALGKQVLQQSPVSDRINISHFPAGFYLLSAFGKDNTLIQTFRIVKQ